MEEITAQDEQAIQSDVDQFFDNEEARGNTIDHERKEWNEDKPDGEQVEMYTGSDKSDLENEREELENFVERTFSKFNVKMNLVLTPTQGNKNAITIPIAAGEKMPGNFVEECLLLALNSERIRRVIRAIVGEPGYLKEQGEVALDAVKVRFFNAQYQALTDFFGMDDLSTAYSQLFGDDGSPDDFFEKVRAAAHDEKEENTEEAEERAESEAEAA